MIYLVRHGETDSNVGGQLQGHLDVPLNKDTLMPKKCETFFHGEFPIPIKTDRRIRENCFGLLAGRFIDSISEDDWVEYRKTPNRFNAETLTDMYNRVVAFMGEVRARHAADENIMVVSHAGAIRMMLYIAQNDVFDEAMYRRYFGHDKISIPNAVILDMDKYSAGAMGK